MRAKVLTLRDDERAVVAEMWAFRARSENQAAARFARIADHLHVSKPTLIQWSHKHQSELAATKANHERSTQESAQASDTLHLEHLILFHKTLRREIIKRTLQTLSDEEIQTLADAIQHQIEELSGRPAEALLAKDGKEISPASNGS